MPDVKRLTIRDHSLYTGLKQDMMLKGEWRSERRCHHKGIYGDHGSFPK